MNEKSENKDVEKLLISLDMNGLQEVLDKNLKILRINI